MDFLAELKTRLSRNAVAAAPESLAAYSYDATRQCVLPGVVVTPLSTEEIAFTVQIAGKYHIPLVTRGAGSGLTGGAVPEKGCILLNLEKMNQILDIDQVENVAIVEPGAVNSGLQARLARYKLFFPCDPGSAEFSTLGGNAAENACGMRGRYYGSCISHVRGLEYVSHEGKTVRTGCLNAGKNILLQNLVIGSEGTLGIIVKLALNLVPVPPAFRTFLAYFRHRPDALRYAVGLLETGRVPLALEFVDGKTFPLIARPDSPFYRADVGAVLLVESAGDGKGFEDALSAFPVDRVITARDAGERKAMWALRNQISPALYNVAPDKINEDVAVPPDRIAGFLESVDALDQKSGPVSIYTFGHLGAGCFHVNLMFDQAEPGVAAEAERLVHEMLGKALEHEGTISAEHGIGLTKKRFLRKELGEPAWEFHRRIKAAFDPDNIFNPGKIFESEAGP